MSGQRIHGEGKQPDHSQATKHIPSSLWHKFGKLSAGAKRGDSTQVYQGALLSREHFRWRFALSVLFLAALWFGLCRELSGEWSVNEQYNFGWFVPFFALYLFWLRWQDRPTPEISSQKLEVRSRLLQRFIGIAALLLLLPVRLFEIANPEWRLLAWIHALAVVTLTLLLLWWAGGKAWLRHFAFPVAFIFIAVPWPTALETPVIQGLMRIVAHVAAETAMLLGTPAQVEGNLIRVSNGLVGVNEACSGIRSLQTSLMIGLLFGEVKRLSVLRRVALVVVRLSLRSSPIFCARFFWSWLPRLKICPRSVAGTTLLVTASSHSFSWPLWRSPICLEKHNRTVVAGGCRAARNQVQPTRLPLQFPCSYLLAALCWLLFIEIGTPAWYRLHERNLISGIRWNVQWPEQAPNFRKLKIDNEIRAVLRFDEGESAAWNADAAGREKSARK